MTVFIVVVVGIALIAVERLWPASALPQVRGWWTRVALVNIAQAGIVILAGFTWDKYAQNLSLLRLSDWCGDISAALIAYGVSCFIYYWWHRIRHESKLFWRLCHQLHHSPRRIEVLTSFYKHPVEITLNSILSSLIVYTLLGLSVQAAALYTVITAVAEFFYHWNVKTPHWLGYFIQRPESHRVHHQYKRHTNNYADLPILDMLFGTFFNPRAPIHRCGFNPRREGQVLPMLAFKDVHQEKPGVVPTCFGCRKRFICQSTANA